MYPRHRTKYLFASLLLAIGLAPIAVRADDDIKARIAAAGDAAKHNADVVTVLDETTVVVRPNGIGTARNHTVTKILREAALRSQSVQVFPFDPHTNRLELIAVRVYRAVKPEAKPAGPAAETRDAKEPAATQPAPPASLYEVEEIPLDTKIEQPQTAWGIFWGTQQYAVAVPRLAVGDAVETITEMTGFNVAYLSADRNAATEGRRDGGSADAALGGLATTGGGSVPAELNARGEVLQPPVPGHWHDEVHFWSSAPVLEKRYTVRVPQDKPLQAEMYNGSIRPAIRIDGDQVVYSFEQKDLVPLTAEPSMESWPNVAPKLLLATLPTWEDKSRWLYGVSEPMFAADDAIAAKVAEIIRDCRTDEEKYTALNHWVAENIRYAGTSRGMCEGYTIHPSVETFHDRAGVCKDKAGMLVTMLRVAGFESYLVMTMARQRVDAVPADQFNHAVTCIRKKDGSLLLLDPTWMPKSRDNWSTLEPLQHVVYGLPEGKGLSQSPDFPPADNQATWRAESTIDAAGGLHGTLRFEAVGAPETALRRALAGMVPADRPALFDASFQRISANARHQDLKHTDPVDFSGPLTVRCGFEAPDYALGCGKQRFLALPMMQTVLGDRTLADLFGQTSLKERKYGLKLRATRLATIEETITLPAGWTPAKLPEPVEIDGPSAGLRFKAEGAGNQIRYSCELTIKKWTIPPAEYANFKEVIEKFEELTGRVARCEVEAAHAQR